MSVALDDIEVLPQLMQQLKRWGLTVEDIRIVAPDLHAVFLRLTGRELRE